MLCDCHSAHSYTHTHTHIHARTRIFTHLHANSRTHTHIDARTLTFTQRTHITQRGRGTREMGWVEGEGVGRDRFEGRWIEREKGIFARLKILDSRFPCRGSKAGTGTKVEKCLLKSTVSKIFQEQTWTHSSGEEEELCSACRILPS